MVDNASIRDDRVIDVRAIDLRGGQKARTGENRRSHIEEVEFRQLGHEVEIGLEKIANGSDVFPIVLEDVGKNAMCFDRVRDDMLAEIGHGVVEQFEQHVAVENVDAHGAEEKL